jgi:hypothetical protein
VKDVSSYWFGYYLSRHSNNWTQTTDEEVWGLDIGATISWKDIPIRGGRSLIQSLIVKFGELSHAELELSLTFPEIPSSFTGYETLPITGNLTISSSKYRIFTVIDNNIFTLSTILDWRTASSSSTSISFSLLPAAFDVFGIQHQFAFYAVNEYGDVSFPQFLYLSGSPIEDENGNRETETPDWLDAASIEVSSMSDTGLAVGVTVGGTVLVLGAAIVGAIFCRSGGRRKIVNAEG